MRKFILLFLVVFGLNTAFAGGGEKDGDFNASEFILHHILDTHDWHVAGDFSIPLPVILWDNGPVVFMSSEFEHGTKPVTKGDATYVIEHEKIYKTSNGKLTLDAKGHPTNEKPLDLSITKNVASMLFAALVLFLLFRYLANSYKKSYVPRGLAGILEPLVLFVKDEIAIPNIGEKKYKKFLPYLLTVFFFIWINNLFGLLPIPPGGGANVTGNIAFTMVLALFTFFIVQFNGNKHYWQHVFWMPGVPLGVKPLMAVIEFIGLFTKPFSLMIRLFANITAGHILILSLIGLIFIFKSYFIAPGSILVVLFMMCIELLVAALQAYVFTLLSAVFIGQAVDDHH